MMNNSPNNLRGSGSRNSSNALIIRSDCPNDLIIRSVNGSVKEPVELYCQPNNYSFWGRDQAIYERKEQKNFNVPNNIKNWLSHVVKIGFGVFLGNIFFVSFLFLAIKICKLF